MPRSGRAPSPTVKPSTSVAITAICLVFESENPGPAKSSVPLPQVTLISPSSRITSSSKDGFPAWAVLGMVRKERQPLGAGHLVRELVQIWSESCYGTAALPDDRFNGLLNGTLSVAPGEELYQDLLADCLRLGQHTYKCPHWRSSAVIGSSSAIARSSVRTSIRLPLRPSMMVRTCSSLSLRCPNRADHTGSQSLVNKGFRCGGGRGGGS
jgi:hypothetical protein